MLIKKLHEKLSQDATLAQSLSELINKPVADGSMTGARYATGVLVLPICATPTRQCTKT